MSPENRPENQARVGRRHPQTDSIIILFQSHLLDGTPPPSYSQVAERFNAGKYTVYEIVKRSGLTEDLRRLRAETNLQEIFSPSRETAWFLGALFGNKGSIDPTRTEISLRGTSDDDPIPVRFRAIGSNLFSTQSSTKEGVMDTLPSGSVAVIFHSAPALRELGDFSKKAKAHTIEKRHGWVLSDEYVKHFASGVFDSGGRIVTAPTPGIAFSTGHEETAYLLMRMLRKLDISGARIERGRNDERFSIIIQRINDLKKISHEITSQDPKKQKKLDSFKVLEKSARKGTFRFPQSAREIFDEWNRVTTLLGEPPKSPQLIAMRKSGDDTFPHAVYTKYFGYDKETGKYSYVKATEELMKLAEMEPAERERLLDAIVVFKGNKKYTEAELIAEWRRMKQTYGDLTAHKIQELYCNGDTQYTATTYTRYFGTQKEKNISFAVAKERLNAAIQVFP